MAATGARRAVAGSVMPADERAAMLDVVRAVMSRVFGVAPEVIAEGSRSDQIERWDSLTMVVVAIGLERRLGRPIEAGSLARIRSVSALLDLLCGKTAQ